MYRQLTTQDLHRFAESLVDKGKEEFIGAGKRHSLLEDAANLTGAEFAASFEGLYAQVCELKDPYVGFHALPTFRNMYAESGQVFWGGLQPSDMVKVNPQRGLEAYHAWEGKVDDNDDRSEGFWCAVTLNELRSGVIGAPWWLLADRGLMTEGEVKAKVSQVIKSQDEKAADRLVRQMVRQMGAGASSASYRGNLRGLFGNCSLARMYWLGKLARKVAVTEKDAADVLAENWLKFADTQFKKSATTSPEIATYFLVKEDNTLVKTVVRTENESEDETLQKIMSTPDSDPMLGMTKVLVLRSY